MNREFEATASEQPLLSLSNYWHIIRKRSRAAVTFFVVVVISAALYSILQPKIYKGTATILIERNSKNILSFDNVFPIETAGRDYYPTQYKILTSRSVATKVMNHLNLWPRFAGASDPVAAFIRQIEIAPIKQSRLVEVSAFSESPAEAAQIADTVVKFYIEQNLSSKLQITQQAVEWLQDKIQEVRKRLAKSELDYEYAKLRKDLLDLNEHYLPKHPKVIQVQERLKQVENKVDEEIRLAEDANIPMLFNRLERDAESNRKIYESMRDRLEETMAAEGMEDTNVVIVDRAEIPKRPVAPRVFLNIFLGFLVGLFGGVGLALVFESLDHTIKSADDVERGGIPVLGVIGHWNVKASELIVSDGLSSPESEFFRAIRTSLLFSSPDRPLRSLLVSSPFQGEGKTLVAANLAATVAQSGARVLLLDADMRKPRVHQIFGQANGRGLTNILATAHDPGEFVFKTAIDNLWALFCGPIPPMPSEVLGSQKMRALVGRLREDFDYLIFDSPPFMVVTDAVVLGSYLDGVLLVTRYDRTPKGSIFHAKQKFREVQANLAGIVINAVDLKQEGYRYSSYDYRYGYGSQKPGRVGRSKNELVETLSKQELETVLQTPPKALRRPSS